VCGAHAPEGFTILPAPACNTGTTSAAEGVVMHTG
jgi:hypothetical protein